MAYALNKQCKECDQPFKANSNRQTYCTECKPKVRARRSPDFNKTYYKKHKDKMLEKTKKYNKSPKGKASELLRTAVRSGKIKRGKCEVCGKPDAQGHHTDYTKPLEVRWLCPKHHMEEHLYESWQVELRRAGYKGGFLLGELIEACGKDFPSLSRAWGSGSETEWICNDPEYNVGSDGEITRGNTPEEAVANLYLALNNKA